MGHVRPLHAPSACPAEEESVGWGEEGGVGVGGEVTERVWDVHFNISPIEKEGHYLVVPDMEQEQSRREQRLTRQDCADMARMAQRLSVCMCVCVVCVHACVHKCARAVCVYCTCLYVSYDCGA